MHVSLLNPTKHAFLYEMHAQLGLRSETRGLASAPLRYEAKMSATAETDARMQTHGSCGKYSQDLTHPGPLYPRHPCLLLRHGSAARHGEAGAELPLQHGFGVAGAGLENKPALAAPPVCSARETLSVVKGMLLWVYIYE